MNGLERIDGAQSDGLQVSDAEVEMFPQRERQLWRYLSQLCEHGPLIENYARQLLARLQTTVKMDLQRPEFLIFKLACFYLAQTQVDDQCYDLVSFVKLVDIFRFRDVKMAVYQTLLFLDFDLCIQ